MCLPPVAVAVVLRDPTADLLDAGHGHRIGCGCGMSAGRGLWAARAAGSNPGYGMRDSTAGPWSALRDVVGGTCPPSAGCGIPTQVGGTVIPCQDRCGGLRQRQRHVDSIRSTRERALRGSRRCIHRTCRATENQFGLSQNFPKLRSMPKQSTFPASYRLDIRRGRAHRPPREGCRWCAGSRLGVCGDTSG